MINPLKFWKSEADETVVLVCSGPDFVIYNPIVYRHEQRADGHHYYIRRGYAATFDAGDLVPPWRYSIERES